jgi:hypothetical protein
MKRIAICTAWGSPFHWTAPAYNLMNLERPYGTIVRFFPGYGRDAGERHAWGVKNALKWGANYITFLGADQIHDEDILIKFYSHLQSSCEIITALVPVRGMAGKPYTDKPFMKLAWKLKTENPPENFVDLTPEHLRLIAPEDGMLQSIDVIGTGAIMFESYLLKRIKKPWFMEIPPNSVDGKRKAGMDTGFVWRLTQEAKAECLCDLSIDVKHIDAFEIDDSYTERFPDWEETTNV